MKSKANYCQLKSDSTEFPDKDFQLNDDIYIAKLITKDIYVFASMDSLLFDNNYILIKRLDYILSNEYVFLNKINDNFYDINTGSLLKEITYEELVALENSKKDKLDSIKEKMHSKELIGCFGIMKLSDFIFKYNIPVSNSATIFDDINKMCGGDFVSCFSTSRNEDDLMAPNKDYMSKGISLILTK